MRFYIKSMKTLNKCLEILGVVATFGMTIFMVLTVLNRFVLGGVLTGCEEFSRIFFCWVLWFMIGCCSNVGNFASIGLFRNVLGKKGKLIHYIFCQLFGIVLSALYVIQGIQFCKNNIGQFYGTLRISAVGFLYCAIPIGFTFLILNCINNIFRAIVMAKGGEVISELSDDGDLSLEINTEELENTRKENN